MLKTCCVGCPNLRIQSSVDEYSCFLLDCFLLRKNQVPAYIAQHCNYDQHTTVIKCSNQGYDWLRWYKEEDTDSLYFYQGECGLDSESVSRVRIWFMDLDSRSRWPPKCNRDVLVQRYICGKIFMQIQLVFLEIWAKLSKNAVSRNIEESFKKFLDTDLDADNSQNLF